ncbi:MAG: hypothetical protein ACYCUG_02210 [Acidimicrobiales bacterium]
MAVAAGEAELDERPTVGLPRIEARAATAAATVGGVDLREGPARGSSAGAVVAAAALLGRLDPADLVGAEPDPLLHARVLPGAGRPAERLDRTGDRAALEVIRAAVVVQPAERLIAVAETDRQVGLVAAAGAGDELGAHVARRDGEEPDAGALGVAAQVVEMLVGLGHLPAGVGEDSRVERVE